MKGQILKKRQQLKSRGVVVMKQFKVMEVGAYF
jgi:hypothetical protein